MAEPTACPECLRRSWLLALLGPYVEKIATGSPGSRSPELLRLSNEDLVGVAAPKVAEQLLARVEALGEGHLRGELAAPGAGPAAATASATRRSSATPPTPLGADRPRRPGLLATSSRGR